MTNAASLSGAGLWGSGLDHAARLSRAADQAAEHAERSGLADLVTGSPMVLAALAVGLALWLVGDRLFRPASSLVGAAIGALVGLVVAGSITTEQVAGVPTPYAAIGLGSLLGLGVGAAMYRLAVGGAAALTLAGVAAAITATVTLHEPGTSSGAPERPETIAEVSQARSTRAAIKPASFGDEITMDELRAAAASTGSMVRSQWETLPEQSRTMALAAAILASVVGFAFGLIRPQTVGPAIAALAGAALWLGATTVLLARAGQPLPPMPMERPGAWLAAWLLVALVGFAVQRRVIRPAALVARDE
jgi:hypothetical protein